LIGTVSASTGHANKTQVGKAILVSVDLIKRIRKLLLSSWFMTAAPLYDYYFSAPPKAEYEANE
jgi:hypothetical protein